MLSNLKKKIEIHCIYWSLSSPKDDLVGVISMFLGAGWFNELGSWITLQLLQAYHQYGVGFRPAL